MAWGTGDVPIKACLDLLAKEKYPFANNIEFSYPIPAGSDAVAEVAKCYKFIKDVLA